MNFSLPRLALAAVSLVSFSLTVWAQSTVDPRFSSSSLAAYPPNISEGTGGPMMMLTASRDHTLFAPIYTDYEDIDGDGEVDYTFKPKFRYYGYFDAKKCYGYSTDGGADKHRFVPVVMASLTDEEAPRLVCPSSQSLWSGNFLNWATMTRLDVVRKTLYGGHRVVDTQDDTTLEMAALAHDAHAFVKYYGGADIRDYTPFTREELGSAGLTLCSRGTRADGQGAPQLRVAKGNYSLWATTPDTVCNWSENQTNFAFGEKARAFYRKYGPPPEVNPYAEQQAHKEKLPSKASDGATYGGIGPELAIRVQACAAAFFGEGDERCRVYRRKVGNVEQVSYKPIGLLQEFGTSELTSQPVRAEFGLISGSYDENFRGGQLRKNIGSVNDEIDLGTGRFCHLLAEEDGNSNCKVTAATFVSAQGSSVPGIIRSFDRISLYQAGNYNAGGPSIPFPLPREVSNGQFPSWGNPMSEMVTQALAYFANLPMGGGLVGSGGRDANLGLPVSIAARDPLQDIDNDPIAGVPRKELYGRAICRPMHMLAISSGAVTHDTDEDGDNEDVYGTAAAFLSKNLSEEEQLKATIQAATDRIGTLEGVNGQSRSVGSVDAGFGIDCTSKTLGTVVTGGLSKVAGVCPEAPAVKGTYLGAGAAFIANTKAVRAPADLTSANGRSVSEARLPAHALRVRSYAATLSGGVARIEVPIPGKAGFVYITPESSWDFSTYRQTNGDLMPGAMLTFRSIYGDANSASYVVTWNDAQFGGDYDMDIVGFLRWERKPSATKPGAYELTVMTDILNHNAGAMGSHGFSIIGTDKAAGLDRRYLTHGGMEYEASGSECAVLKQASNLDAYNLRCSFLDRGMRAGSQPGVRPDNLVGDGFKWPTQFDGRDVGFLDSNAPLTTTVATKFVVTEGVADVALHDPLWYMAKYGSFSTGETKFALSTAAVPDAANGGTPVNWDKQSNSGQTCGSNGCADGEPDGYFLARRPELLEERLRNLLRAITQGSNSAPAVSSSQLLSDSLKYTAEFSQDGFGGTVKAFALETNGTFNSEVGWSATELMTAAGTGRVIITDNGQTGLVFDWAGLNVPAQVPYRAAMLGVSISSPVPTEDQIAAVNAQASRASRLIGYMRGDTAHEGTSFRVRRDGVMGPIVNSTPWLQSGQVAGRYTDADFAGRPSYRAFVNSTKAAAAPVLWVGANDGQLHGLHALTGEPLMSYVPSPLVSRLESALAAGNSGPVALMDGSPYTGDVLVSPVAGFGAASGASTAQPEWRTYLFSSLGRGGRAVFALDVTNPDALTTTATAPAAFKWVFSSRDDDGLGYQLLDPVRHPNSGQPSQIVHLNNGDFGLLVPNGYGSNGGKAALFILSVNGPGSTGVWQLPSSTSLGSYRKIVVSGNDDTQNGLMGATWVDLDNNGTADVVYATDLRGQLWKFDLRSADPREWKSALMKATVEASGAITTTEDPEPLFSATSGTTALSITTAPVTFFPNFGGTMVSFGTGRAIESVDFPNTTINQRFFTVWDKGRYPGDLVNPPIVGDESTQRVVNDLPRIDGTRTIGARSVKTFVKRLLRRDADGNVYQVQTDDVGEPVLKDGLEVPLVDGLSTQAFKPAENDGWYMEFPSAGEAVISSPLRRLNFILFTTVRPKSSTEREISCSVGPQGALYAFSPVSGLPIRSLLSESSLLMGKDISDQKVIALSDASDGSPVNTGGQTKTRGLGTNTDETLNTSASNLRLQWREITGLRTRANKSTEEEKAPAAESEDK